MAMVVNKPFCEIEERNNIASGRDDDKVVVVEDGDATGNLFDANVDRRVDNNKLAAFGHADSPPKMLGDRDLNVLVSPLPRNKRAKNPRQAEAQDVAAAPVVVAA